MAKQPYKPLGARATAISTKEGEPGAPAESRAKCQVPVLKKLYKEVGRAHLNVKH